MNKKKRMVIARLFPPDRGSNWCSASHPDGKWVCTRPVGHTDYLHVRHVLKSRIGRSPELPIVWYTDDDPGTKDHS